ncbi:MAG: uroporphyrinogen decarboxylase family protein [Candidatus Zipacnadales bacterium]
MSYRNRILSALRHEPVVSIPWVPRLDLWYNAHRYRGTLPPEWEGASLMDIVADLGVGYHAVIPDFLNTEEPDEACDRLLGIEHVANQPYRVRFQRTERFVEHKGDDLRVTYRSPAGTLSGCLRYDEGMRRDGITIMAVTERLVKSLEDYEVVGFLFEDLVIEPDQTRYQTLVDEIGEAGLVVAWGHVAASPVHHLLKELVPYGRFFYDLHDHPEVIKKTAQRLEGYFEAVLEACASSSANVVLFGANYDVMLTPPNVFEPHILPMLSHWADRLHRVGKLLLTHTDGENDGLLKFFLQAGVDVADSVCPAPMTRLPFATYREAFRNRIAIWGGICSTAVLPEAYTEEEFEAHLDEVLNALDEGRGIILSIADTTPPMASLKRLRYIGERIGAWA